MKQVGWIGLGAMGLPMAKCLAASGVKLMVYDTNPQRMKLLQEDNPDVIFALDICALGSACDIVFTMLPDAKTVVQVVSGKSGLFSSMKKESIWVDMTTGDPSITEELIKLALKQGIHGVDAPVGRTPQHAEKGDLLALVGGETSTIDQIMPLLRTMASEVILCGAAGTGHTMKLINNLLSGVIQEANIEAISIGLHAGISISTMLHVFQNVCVWNGYLAALPYEQEAAPGWSIDTAEKHMQSIQKLAEKSGVSVCCVDAVSKRMKEMIAQGKGTAKYSNIRTLLKASSGLELPEILS